LTNIDEEKVECFIELMATIGQNLEHQSAKLRSIGKAESSKNLASCWTSTKYMAGKKNPSATEQSF
jgi:hypothetical protein